MEAQRLLGEHAHDYLDLRTSVVIQDLFETLKSNVTAQTEFCGIENHGKVLSLLIQKDLETYRVSIGTICNIGYTCRLLVPFNLKQRLQAS